MDFTAPTKSGAQAIDFEDLLDTAPIYVSGTAADLIRDGHDEPQPWVQNVDAVPDDMRSAFLIGRGWSCTADDRFAIESAGFPTMAINDYPKDGPAPWYWCSGDPPSCYSARVFGDANVTKFLPLTHSRISVSREDNYAPMRPALHEPNVHFFHHVNNEMDMQSWLHTPYIAWGTSLWGENTPPQLCKEGAARSSMLIGLRLLWHLGYREVYLIGCDCTPHHHGMPKYWKVIFHMLEQLAPVFRKHNFNVYQTNPHSHLRCFDFVDFKEVLQNQQKAEREERYKSNGVNSLSGQSDNQFEDRMAEART